jgi:nucleoside-diphosphate-sugar epimerase
LGRFVVRQLMAGGHSLRCWRRPESNTDALDDVAAQIDWVAGRLGDPDAAENLICGCDAVVHAALWRPGRSFRGGEGDVVRFAQENVIGTLQLIEAARAAGASRFVFVSTCAVHEKILDDRPLDETHPAWPLSHYGAHKAALEAFVHSYGWGHGYDICALRPTGIYGVAHPVQDSKWYELVLAVARGQTVTCRGGGKEVHAADVARAIEILLTADGIAGQAYNCYDRYVSEYDVATLAKELCGSPSRIVGEPKQPKTQIATERLRDLGMQFGGPPLLRETIRQLLERVRGQIR